MPQIHVLKRNGGMHNRHRFGPRDIEQLSCRFNHGVHIGPCWKLRVGEAVDEVDDNHDGPAAASGSSAEPSIPICATYPIGPLNV